MGGHGGLNILPQKKWNVYNYDNRDIVEKDKIEHAAKMKVKYQTDREGVLQRKFDVLKADIPQSQMRIQKIKQSRNKDSVLNNEFRRLAQQKRHVNLFQKEQKIIQNREVLQYQQIKQAEQLKNKSIDYSSKFLGTYDQVKAPWYAVQKNIESKAHKKIEKERHQRYDMEDLTDKLRVQTLRSKQYYKEDLQKIQKAYGVDQTQINKILKSQLKQQEKQKQQRERSRNQKYQFIKKIHIKEIKQVKVQEQVETKYVFPSEIDGLRAKRLRREQKQRKKAELLKLKFLYNHAQST